MTPNEEWRPVVGFEDYYEVSSLGRVRSLDRLVGTGPGGNSKRLLPGRVLSAGSGTHYRNVSLKVNKVATTRTVHTLVAEAFLGPRPEGHDVCHNNGDRHDNRAENLRYDSHAVNQRDQLAHGTHALASRTHCNKGHEFTSENTMRRTGGNEAGRRCRACERERTQRRVAAGEFRKKES